MTEQELAAKLHKPEQTGWLEWLMASDHANEFLNWLSPVMARNDDNAYFWLYGKYVGFDTEEDDADYED